MKWQTVKMNYYVNSFGTWAKAFVVGLSNALCRLAPECGAFHSQGRSLDSNDISRILRPEMCRKFLSPLYQGYWFMDLLDAQNKGGI